MKKRWLGLILLWVLGSESAQAFEWGDLWRNSEQRAQQMLDAGHPDAAAKAFADPQRKAYAQARAGQDAEAAKTLAGAQSSDALFNRGNALARAGQLKEALAAYDEALKKNPQDAQANSNRKRVEDALKAQQQEKQDPASSKGSDSKSEPRKDGADSGQSAQGKGQDSRQAPGQPAGQGKPSPQSGSQSSSASTAKADPSGGNTKAQDKAQASAQQSASAAAQPPSGLPKQGASDVGQKGSQTGSQTGSQAHSEAAAEQARQQALLAAQSQPANGSTGNGMTQGSKPKSSQGHAVDGPKSEQAMAMEEWLRRIPDDPGGLLRRKFQIEHDMRQKQGENAP